ncbi:cellulase family glycosylhydrolase [Sphingomonas crusticola]|uniref:cellulase family glycosylhydrolase n=1 Tax=Sphingomonas crusticola TaxID=1697973 RepID=UPI000E256E0F|nr:cellulase family glycosylhydrolase [Sphingomonas crusticola]
MKATFWIAVSAVALAASSAQAADTRWSAAQANVWYAKQSWLTGANYIPASAINQLEMWQAATWDPAQIDKELGWAQTQFGMNTMRVFLHDLAWQEDPAGFKQRMDQFLAIAARHGIKPVFVFFDSCWDPDPKIGPQHPPIPGVHNSGWVQGPSRTDLVDPKQDGRFKAYVEDVIGTFAQDNRVLAWDMWNEPDNGGGGSYNGLQLAQERARITALLPRIFGWARSKNPIQPLTSGVWAGGDWSPANAGKLDPIQRIQLEQSDVITFHNYDWPEQFEQRVSQLRGYGRPIICTEWMARSAGSTVDAVLPIARRQNVGMINWGFAKGRIQTNLPWDSWERPYTLQQPVVWFHDLVQPDGQPYRAREAEIFRSLRAQPAR